jgi:hypothetical protein
VPADDNQVKTYRYLRLGMVLVIVMLFAAIALDRWETGGIETSISDYVTTSALPVFIGALITIGACMVIIRGYIDVEDIALNLAGLLAPIVAFVPVAGRQETITNNVYALLIAETAGLIGAAVFVWRSWRRPPAPTPGAKSRQVVGLALAAGIVLATYLWLRVGDATSPKGAHYTAAVLLFVFIGIVVYINAIYFESPDGWPPSRRWYRALYNRYGLIAVGMIVVPAAMALVWLFTGWEHVLLWVEAALIVLFAVFWIIQTLQVRTAHTLPPTARAAGATTVL